MSPSISEILFGLDYNASVVGVSKFATYPQAVKKLPKVGGYFHPNLEKILSLKPTLVIAQKHNHALLHKLQKLGIKTLSVSLDSIENIKKSIHSINTHLQNHPQEQRLITNIDNAIKNAPKVKNRPKVLIIYGAKEDLNDGVYVASQHIFYNEILEICGAQNAFTASLKNEPQLFYEHIVALQPDSIIIFHYPLTDGDVNLTQVKKMYKTLPTPASKNGRITILTKDYLAIPSQRVAQTITTLCTTIKHQYD